MIRWKFSISRGNLCVMHRSWIRWSRYKNFDEFRSWRHDMETLYELVTGSHLEGPVMLKIIVWFEVRMMTLSNGNIFRVTGHFCGEFTGQFPAQRPVTRSFDVFFDLRLNKRLSKQSWGRWFETLLRPLWRHPNGPDKQLKKRYWWVAGYWRRHHADVTSL